MRLRAGVDLGGTKIEAIVVDGSNKVLGQARAATPAKDGPGSIADQINKVVTAAAKAAGVKTSSLQGVGLGSPGTIDAKAGTVQNASNLSGMTDPFPLAPTLEKLLDTAVYLGNDVQVATNAEFELGAGRPYQSLLGVFWGTGVGAGLILAGKPWLGRGAAGEIGHVVVNMGGAKCYCGKRGCMEAYAGRAALEQQAHKAVENGKKTNLFKIAKEKGKDRLTSTVWEHALKTGDKLAIKLIDRAISALGVAIASTQNLLDIEAVIVGGGMGSRFGDQYVRKIGQQMQAHLFVSTDPPALQVAGLGDLGGALGAALLAR